MVPRKLLRAALGIITGHCGVKYHFAKMDLSDTSECPLCLNDVDTVEHMLCNCPATEARRLLHLGDVRFDYEYLKLIPIKSIFAFIRDIGRWDCFA